jgi:hypothetical protein
VTTGTAIVVVAGVAGVGVGGYLLIRKLAPAQAAPALGTTSATVAAGLAGAGARAPAPSSAQTLANGVQSVRTSVCTVGTSAIGVPRALAGTVCSAYVNYPTVALHAVEKIPIVGGAVKVAANAVEKGANSVVSGVKSILGSIF